MGTTSLKIAHVTYIYEDPIWVADCKEVGMVGYQGQNLEKVKKLVAEGLQLYFADQLFEIHEEFVDEVLVKPSTNQ
jgi:predicted RNase H-like HicB family nuclease